MPSWPHLPAAVRVGLPARGRIHLGAAAAFTSVAGAGRPFALGIRPVQTDVQFDKLSDCLSAEEQLRNTYADAYEAWDRSAALNIERRRDYRKAREFQERRLANTGTCIPHAGTDQPVTMTPRTVEQPAGIAPPQSPLH